MTRHSIAYFITPHGFGHATRAAAIMAAAQQRDAQVRFEIFTRVPQWLFEQSLRVPYGYHEVLTDIGLAQQDSLHEDIAETVRRLDGFLPFDPAFVDPLARDVSALGCETVVCDIAPLGIAVAQAAGIPSVLVENFTWDWIYGGYIGDATPVTARLIGHIDYLRGVFESASYRIQTEPVCLYRPSDLVTAPVSRSPHMPAADVRAQLGVPGSEKLVLITMGGLSAGHQHTFLDILSAYRGVCFVIPGSSSSTQRSGNAILLPDHSALYHPDIIHAADVVIGKTGYSTVAEAYHAGLPYGYVSRPRFRESDVMAAFIQAHLCGVEFSEVEFQSGAWLGRLPELLAMERLVHRGPNGAEQVADFLLSINR